jgi:hypothetical protein
MPNLNGTGPHGQGPMTGGRRGRCRNPQLRGLPTAKQTGEAEETFGLGRGGRPYGGGKGNCYGGGKFRNTGKAAGKQEP